MRVFVHDLREPFVGSLVAGSRGVLNLGNRERVPGMLLTGLSPVILAGVRQHGQRLPFALREADFVPLHRFLAEHFEIDTFDAAGGS